MVIEFIKFSAESGFIFQNVAHEFYRHPAFANSGRIAFNRTVANVSCGKTSGNARFQKERGAFQWPNVRWSPGLVHICTGEQVTERITENRKIACPLRVWPTSNTNKELCRRLH